VTHFLTFVAVLISVTTTLIGIWYYWHKRCNYAEDAYFLTVVTIAGIGMFGIILHGIWKWTA
jgi:hypothetical protein